MKNEASDDFENDRYNPFKEKISKSNGESFELKFSDQEKLLLFLH